MSSLEGSFVIYRDGRGFVCENEDIMGNDYDTELDEYTVRFDSEEKAYREALNGEYVLEVNGRKGKNG